MRMKESALEEKNEKKARAQIEAVLPVSKKPAGQKGLFFGPQMPSNTLGAILPSPRVPAAHQPMKCRACVRAIYIGSRFMAIAGQICMLADRVSVFHVICSM